MFLRRAPSYTIAKSLLSTNQSLYQTGRNSIRTGLRTCHPVFSKLTSRTLHSTSHYKQYAGTVPKEEDLDDEAEFDEESRETISATHSRVVKEQPNEPNSSMGSRVDAAEKLGPVTKFHELADRQLVSPVLVRTLVQDMGLETMTEVQSLTINQTLKGKDVLAQARTGTGKTLAFLIPVVQNIIEYDHSLEKRQFGGQRRNATDIRAIIISPTRELAEQIAAEAQKLLGNRTNIVIQTAVGGSQKSFHLRKMRMEGCHILVGTPGRLNDLLSDPDSGVRAPNLSAFVLDEADRLLDQGFLPEIAAIQKLLPDRRQMDRQTLLFSATVPPEVMDVVRRTMKPDFTFVRTVQEGEQQTHERVPQKLVWVKGFENLLPSLLELCQREIARKDARPFKAIVYFGATAEATLAYSTFRNLTMGTERPVQADMIVIHGKLTQSERTAAAERFRRGTSAILFSSDVTARGMDFPGVTHVIQIGLPANRDTYIHRIGRTARAGREGEGWLLATPLEQRELRERLYKLPLRLDTSLETATVDMTQDAELPEPVALALTRIVEASGRLKPEWKTAAYMATLGMFQWCRDKQALLDAMNRRAKFQWVMDPPPGVPPALVTKLGLSGVRGINIRKSSYGAESESGFGGPRRFNNDRYDPGRSNYGGYRERSSFGDRGSSVGGRYSGGGASRSGYGGGYGGGGRSSGGGYGGREGGRSLYGDRGSSGSRYSDGGSGGERGSPGFYSDRARSSYANRATGGGGYGR